MIISILIFVLVQTYSKSDLLKTFFRIVATSKDRRGVEFISMMEGIASITQFFEIGVNPSFENFIENVQASIIILH